MPSEKEKDEWLANIRSPDQFKHLEQIWPSKYLNTDYPYNTSGIRAIGGELKSGKITEQTIRFSKDVKYNWTEDKIKSWLRKNDYHVKEISLDVLKLYAKSNKPNMWLSSPNFKIKSEFKAGEPLIIEGIINSDAVDTYGEIVDPDAVIESMEFYMRYPTVRYMHQAEPIGRTIKIWKDKNFVWATIEIDPTEEKIIQKIINKTITAFSIGFLAVDAVKTEIQENVFVWTWTKIFLIEISPVDSPANRDAEIKEVGYKSNDDKGAIDIDVENTEQRTTTVGVLDPNFDLAGIKQAIKVKSSKGLVFHMKVAKKSTDETESVEEVEEEEVEQEEASTDDETTQEVEQETETDDDSDKEKEDEEETESEAEEEEPSELLIMQDKVKEMENEIRRIKLTEDERIAEDLFIKQAEPLIADYEKQITEKDARIAELEAEVLSLTNEKTISDEVEKRLKQGPASKRSLLNDDDTDEELEAEKIRNKYGYDVEPEIANGYTKLARKLRGLSARAIGEKTE